MHPLLFQIGSLKITCFGAMAACGFLAASFLLFANMKERGLNSDNVNDLFFICIVAGILGARLFYVIQFWDEFKNNLLMIPRVDKGGIVFYGGFIAAVLAIYIYSRRKKLNFFGVIDVMAPSLALGHAFGRIGCFLNGCCFGRPCDLPWAVRFPQGSMPEHCYPGASLHPVQLYESLFNFALAGLLFVFLRKTKVCGRTAALYLVCYGIGRFTLELFRGDNAKIMSLMSVSQIIGIATAIAGVGIYIATMKRT